MERSVRSITSSRVAWTLLILAAFFASRRLALARFWQVWESPDHYYSHGLLVPVLAALMVRANWGRLKRAKASSSWLGVFFAFVALILEVVGAATGFEELSGLAFLVAVFAVILTLYGLPVARVLFWPVLFLTTMIPLPQIALDGVTSKLQILSSVAAAHALRLVDSSVVAHGNVIVGDRLPGPLLVAPACSGLRLTIALVMCAWFLVYMLQGSWRQKLALGLLALPLGSLVNTARITVIGWAAMRTGSVGSFHDVGGYIGLAACSALLLGAAWLMGMRGFRDPDAGDSDNVAVRGSPDPAHTRLSAFAKPALVLVLAVSTLASTAITGVYDDLPCGRIERRHIPLSLAGWRATALEIDSISRNLLRNADLMSLVYRNPAAPGRDVYVLIDSAVDISMLHDPRLCLSGAGGSVSDQRIVSLKSSDPRLDGAPAWLLYMQDPDGPAQMLCVYRAPGEFLATKDAVNAYTFRARLGDLKRLCQNPATLKTLKSEVGARRITWYRFVTYCGDRREGSALLQAFAARFVSGAMGPIPPQPRVEAKTTKAGD